MGVSLSFFYLLKLSDLCQFHQLELFLMDLSFQFIRITHLLPLQSLHYLVILAASAAAFSSIDDDGCRVMELFLMFLLFLW